MPKKPSKKKVAELPVKRSDEALTQVAGVTTDMEKNLAQIMGSSVERAYQMAINDGAAVAVQSNPNNSAAVIDLPR